MTRSTLFLTLLLLTSGLGPFAQADDGLCGPPEPRATSIQRITHGVGGPEARRVITVSRDADGLVAVLQGVGDRDLRRRFRAAELNELWDQAVPAARLSQIALELKGRMISDDPASDSFRTVTYVLGGRTRVMREGSSYGAYLSRLMPIDRLLDRLRSEIMTPQPIAILDDDFASDDYAGPARPTAVLAADFPAFRRVADPQGHRVQNRVWEHGQVALVVAKGQGLHANVRVSYVLQQGDLLRVFVEDEPVGEGIFTLRQPVRAVLLDPSSLDPNHPLETLQVEVVNTTASDAGPPSPTPQTADGATQALRRTSQRD